MSDVIIIENLQPPVVIDVTTNVVTIETGGYVG